jgi:hypothetical protein
MGRDGCACQDSRISFDTMVIETKNGVDPVPSAYLSESFPQNRETPMIMTASAFFQSVKGKPENSTLLDKESWHLYSGKPDWRDVRVVDGGGLENR